MRIDSHQHFWHYTPQEYGWIGPEMAVLRRDFLPDDLAPILCEAGIDGSVAVQARQTLAETRWLLDLAARFPFIRGVVGWVDLRSSDLPAQLEELAVHPKLRGVRHVVQDEPDDRFMLRDDFVRGIGQLARWSLAYDILVYPRQLPAACDLVARFPEQVFVLDHIAKPSIRDQVLEPWAAHILRLARHPNVFCKLSGMVTEADWQRWQPADLRPYLGLVLEAFSPQRLMFGSDWPVCTVAGRYADVAGLVYEAVRELSADEQAAVWGETARRAYGLE